MLFSEDITIEVPLTDEELTQCASRRVLKRTVRSTRAGTLNLSYERGKTADGKHIVPKELSSLVPDGKSFGFDTIWDVTRMRYHDCLQREEVQKKLPFHISTGSVTNLSREGLVYFMLCQFKAAQQLGDYFRKDAFILNIDGTNEGGKYTHYRCIDNLTGIVVFARKIKSENADDIAEILREIVRSYGQPHAVVSDMSAPTRKAIVNVFGEDFPHVICQFHFLRDVGKDILADIHIKLRNHITGHSISHKLKRYKDKLSKLVSETNGKLQEDYRKIHELVLWILDYKSELTGKGIPFDLGWMHYYERCRSACEMIDKVEKKYERRRETRKGRKQPPVPKKDTFWVQLSYIRTSLHSLLKDRTASATYNELKRRDVLFSELREAFHAEISVENYDNKRCAPLNKDAKGDINAIPASEVKRNLDTIRDRISSQEKQTAPEEIVMTHIEKYYDGLTAKLVINGQEILLPRTNNISENNFRGGKRCIRMTCGLKNLSKILDQTPAETAYIQNIDNPAYMNIVFGNCEVYELFPLVDTAEFKTAIKQIGNNMPEYHVGKAIRQQSFIKDLQKYLIAS